MLLVPLVLVAFGTTGYRMVEGWPLFDALYMTVITLTTVGFLEVHTLSTAGRAFTMVLAVGGVFTAFYAATTVIGLVVSGELRGEVERRRMEKTLQQLRNHIIVCGYGRMGHLVCEEFSELGLPFVIVDRDPAAMEGFSMTHGIAVAGDATSDELLRRVGVDRARCLVTVVASDSDNLYITMSARLLNERLQIVARAEDAQSEVKLRRAGATRVVAPYVIGGHRVAQAVLRPAVTDFLELATRHDFPDLQIEETVVEPGSVLDQKELRATKIRSDLGIILVAIRKRDGRHVFNPPAETLLEAEDLLITLGHTDQLLKLEAMSRAQSSA
jgi:voltage-gated potassium channel